MSRHWAKSKRSGSEFNYFLPDGVYIYLKNKKKIALFGKVSPLFNHPPKSYALVIRYDNEGYKTRGPENYLLRNVHLRATNRSRTAFQFLAGSHIHKVKMSKYGSTWALVRVI